MTAASTARTDALRALTIPSELLPSDGRFGSGPSRVRDAQMEALSSVSRTVMGTSHRQAPVKQVVARVRQGLAELFSLPEGYEVVLGNGGASAFWDVMCASLITRQAACGVYGSFSKKVASSVASAPFLEDPIVFESEPGTYCVPERTEYVDTYCWAQNETSTGVQAPVYRIDGSREQGALTHSFDVNLLAGATLGGKTGSKG